MNIGNRFGRLIVTARAATTGGHRRWQCRCDCGNSGIYRESHLLSGATRSCRCLARETTGQRVRTHGLRHTREYGIWKTMKNRCHSASVKSYAGYGGRGIRVCDRWRESFTAFYADMGPRPSPLHSIDRIDNDGPYSPENCRWATKTMQVHNSSKIRHITAYGQTLPLVEWSRRTGLNARTISARIRSGWSAERAVTTPTQ